MEEKNSNNPVAAMVKASLESSAFRRIALAKVFAHAIADSLEFYRVLSLMLSGWFKGSRVFFPVQVFAPTVRMSLLNCGGQTYGRTDGPSL